MTARKLKPMKAADLAKLLAERPTFEPKLPKLLSPKVDGYRCMIYHGGVYSANGTPIVNRFTQELFAGLPGYLDGELVVGPPTAGNALAATQSGLKRADGEPDVALYVFDSFAYPSMAYARRLEIASEVVKDTQRGSTKARNRIHLLSQIGVSSMSEIMVHEAAYLAQGYEGVMLRDPLGPYKFGRSSVTEDDLWKLKRFMDGEGVVIAVEEAEENTNDAFSDAFGRTKRSSAKAGKVGKGMVGTIIVQDPTWGELRLSPGTMPHSERLSLWSDGRRGRTLVGMTVHWRAFGYGVKDKPRFPRYYGVRMDA